MIKAILLDAIALYVAIGLVIAVLFVTVGIARVLGQGVTATMPARILWIPGATALWPYVLVRWLIARSIR
jgi:hypothetical protein